MRLHSRLDALERKKGSGLSHCVLWHPGVPFDDALALSYRSANSTERLLIEMVPVCMDRNPVPLTAEQHVEQMKAHAWSDKADV